jgi:hypothetical protein
MILIAAIKKAQFITLIEIAMIAVFAIGILILIRQHRNHEDDFKRRHGLK